MPRRCLVTGATGYIGGRLVPRLLDGGFDVRCIVRDPAKLRDVPWRDRVDVVRGDVTTPADVARALEGMDFAYYLVHSLAAAGFEETDRSAAKVFADAARAAGVRRIIYLGGLEPSDAHMSPHLRSRQEVGQVLASSGADTVVLRAAIILGSGSASFEMLRYLTERLPVMVTPRWVRNRVQPIAVRDVLRHLVAAASAGPEVAGWWDIGGPDVLTYAQLMQRYARAAGLRPRVIVPLPVLSPRLSSYWVNLVTPVPGRLARPLVESLRHEMVSAGPGPPWSDQIEPPLGVDEALRLALQRVREAAVETRWSTAAWSGAPSDPLPSDPAWAGGSLYVDERAVQVDAPPEELWRVVESVGGENGWYSYPLLWALRGHLDRLVGGVGLSRGRRDPERLAPGDSLDWWRVEELDRGRLLRLRAEMRVPGLAWLELRVEPDPAGSSVYRQRAVFHPRGLAGHAYWWAVAPFHGLVFGGMLRNIKAAAEDAPAGRRSCTMNRLRLRTAVAAPPELCYRLALTIPVQERALTRVRARAEPPVDEQPLITGRSVTWTARWLRLPWHMTTRIVSADPPVEFVDEQVSGPFGHWHHRHRFTACDGGTLMEDDVSWSAPLGLAGRIVVALGLGRFVAELLRDHNRRLAAEIESAAT